jgi:hypothetical protein
LAPPFGSAFARAAAVAAGATRVATTAAVATTITAAITTTITAAVTAEVATATAAALAAVMTFAAVFAAGLRGGAFRRDEDGFVGDAEQGGELALHRRPEADGGLDGDDDWLNLDTRTFLAARAILATGPILATGAVALRRAFLAGFTRFATFAGLAAGATFEGAAIRGDAGLAAFGRRGAFGLLRTRFARGARFAGLAGFATLARLLGRLLGAITRERFGQFGRVLDDADGRAGRLTGSGRGASAGRATAAELLRGQDRARGGGGFVGGTDDGQGREFRVGGFQLGCPEVRGGGADFVGARVRGGLLGGDVLLALGFFLAHVAWVGAAFVWADR